jgi:hypothetical protein
MKDNSKLVTEQGKRDFWALGLRLPDLYSVDVPNNLIEGKTNEAGCLGSGGKLVASTPATAGLEYLKEVLSPGGSMGLFPSQLPSISGKIKPEMACRNGLIRIPITACWRRWCMTNPSSHQTAVQPIAC